MDRVEQNRFGALAFSGAVQVHRDVIQIEIAGELPNLSLGLRPAEERDFLRDLRASSRVMLPSDRRVGGGQDLRRV
jgi:hypothetical protein